MNKEMKNLRSVATPSSEFKERLWQRLDAEMPVVKIRSKKRMAVAGTLASIAMLLSGSGAYAYSSPNVTPESPLYGVKTGIEDVQERFKKSPEARAKFHKAMAQRRGHELDRAKSPEAQAELRIRLAELLDMTQEELKEASQDPEFRAQISDQVKALREAHHIETFEKRRADMLERLDTAIENGAIDADRVEEITERIINAEPREVHRMHEERRPEGEFDREHFNMKDRIHRTNGPKEAKAKI